jgi:hypothetical protein
MTLILAGRVNNSAILAADSRVKIKSLDDGTEHLEVDNKLFVACGCAVASSGCSGKVKVPELVNGFANTHGRSKPCVLADEVLAEIKAKYQDHERGEFSLLILGNGEEQIELWEVLSKSAEARRLDDFRSGDYLQRGTPISRTNGISFVNLNSLRAQMDCDFEQVSKHVMKLDRHSNMQRFTLATSPSSTDISLFPLSPRLQ